ncbi:MAG: hypothetical protein Ct9H300mP29_8730 [Candidatus Neomarinimicrobiota bacterium]|nr:MAG: hypothetical protein Ct9H300mP29_8730 [Candidatus Neomarinimicrobiota bacterium]
MLFQRLRFFSVPVRFTSHPIKLDQPVERNREKMPWTMAAFTIATLSMIGIPPVSAYYKVVSGIGSMERHR